MSTDVVITIPEFTNNDDVIEDILDEIVTNVENDDTVIFIDDDDRTCVICLENLPKDTAMFGCKHEIHVQCAIPYVMGKFHKNDDITCPTCRFVQCAAITPNYRTWRLQFGVTDPPARYTTVGIDDNIERQVRNAMVIQRSLKYYIGMTCAIIFLVVFSTALILLIILSALSRSNQTS